MGALGIATGEDTTVLTMRLHLEVDVATSVRLAGPDVTIAQAVSETVVATGQEIAKALETAGDATGRMIVTETNIVVVIHEADLEIDDTTGDLTLANFDMAANLANNIQGRFTGSEAFLHPSFILSCHAFEPPEASHIKSHLFLRDDILHDGSKHLAINNTFVRRFLARLALHTVAKFYLRDGLCVPISRHKIVKTGRRVHLTEGATMKYLAEKTTIPVPKVHCSFLHKNRAYIVMERIQGEELPKAWNSLAQESVEDIFPQLRKVFQELRALTPPNTGVESCVKGSLYDSRLPRGNPRFGPFRTIQEFHIWLRQDLKPEDLKDREQDQDWYDLQDMMRKQKGSWPPPVFTHGDLNPFNILVRGGKMVEIIDWEFSGWHPHYWEYTSAWFGNVTRTEWQGMLDKFLDRPSADEFRMEEIRNKWWGE